MLLRNLLLSFCAMLVASAVSADETGRDRHAGYYYPEPAQVEVYKARAQVLADTSRGRRIDFVVAMANSMLARPYAPTYSIFVKGEEAEKLIIVSNVSGQLNTVYRARALLATLTSVARTTPAFREYGVEDIFTFFDLLKLMGFARVTVTDGDTYAHQVDIE
jgi:hypothetical protein